MYFQSHCKKFIGKINWRRMQEFFSFLHLHSEDFIPYNIDDQNIQILAAGYYKKYMHIRENPTMVIIHLYLVNFIGKQILTTLI